MLKRDDRISSVIGGDHVGAVARVFTDPRPVENWEVISSDLTSASDLLPLDLVEALVEGVIAGL